MRMRTWSGLLAIGAVVGCSARIIDAGSGDGGSASAGSSSGSSAGSSSASGSSAGSSSTGSGSNSPVSVYKGYIESFMFASGSDTVVMNLQFPGDGTVTGTVYFGDGPPLAPPTNPDVGYPVGVDYGVSSVSIEGFAFTVLDGKDDNGRVTLQIDQSELFKKWCELQTTIYPLYNWPAPADGGILGYGCLPNDGYQISATGVCSLTPADAGLIPVDCGKLNLCEGAGVCNCTATACTVDLVTTSANTFDMQLTGNELNGSEEGIPGQSGTSSGPHNVHLDMVQ
jgi:hypothetical protein